MSKEITKCNRCDSTNIKELNPEIRDVVKKPLCSINCECNDCGNLFSIKSWTKNGKRKGIRY